jgi:predicted amidohydrolase YtcJ
MDGICTDIIFYNGKIVTVDDKFSIKEAVAVKNGRIENVGSNAAVLQFSEPQTQRIDRNGKTVLPGLIDAHLHPTGASTSEIFEEIPDVTSLQELLEYISSQKKIKRTTDWIVHPKFFPTRMIEMREPTLIELDNVAPDHPVFLNGSYAGIVNSCAMRLAGISNNMQNPGIHKDPVTGEPTGKIKASVFPLIKKHYYRGILNLDRKQLFDIIAVAHEFGWKMTAHVTGGGGVDMLLDAYENANKETPISGRRFSIIHGNFYTKKAIDRCKRLGVIADFQPAWFYKDANAMRYILGDERIKAFLPIRSMLEAGIILNAGSDHMVKYDSYRSINPYHPFLSMWTLITRKTDRGSVICPTEAISRKQALKMYTINNAYGTFEEHIIGSSNCEINCSNFI